MIIPKKIKSELIQLAKNDLPIETCGYLAGNLQKVEKIFPMTNIDKSNEHFSFDPKDQFATIKEARNNNLDILAVYHSHPETPARLSEEDKKFANDPNLFYLIISLENKLPVLKAFKRNQTDFESVDISFE